MRSRTRTTLALLLGVLLCAWGVVPPAVSAARAHHHGVVTLTDLGFQHAMFFGQLQFFGSRWEDVIVHVFLKCGAREDGRFDLAGYGIFEVQGPATDGNFDSTGAYETPQHIKYEKFGLNVVTYAGEESSLDVLHGETDSQFATHETPEGRLSMRRTRMGRTVPFRVEGVAPLRSGAYLRVRDWARSVPLSWSACSTGHSPPFGDSEAAANAASKDPVLRDLVNVIGTPLYFGDLDLARASSEPPPYFANLRNNIDYHTGALGMAHTVITLRPPEADAALEYGVVRELLDAGRLSILKWDPLSIVLGRYDHQLLVANLMALYLAGTASEGLLMIDADEYLVPEAADWSRFAAARSRHSALEFRRHDASCAIDGMPLGDGSNGGESFFRGCHSLRVAKPYPKWAVPVPHSLRFLHVHAVSLHPDRQDLTFASTGEHGVHVLHMYNLFKDNARTLHTEFAHTNPVEAVLGDSFPEGV